MHVALPPSGRMGQLSAGYRIKPSPHNLRKRLPAPSKAVPAQDQGSARLNQGSTRLDRGSAECDTLRPETMYACGNFTQAPLWGDTHGRALAAACPPPLYGSRLPEV